MANQTAERELDEIREEQPAIAHQSINQMPPGTSGISENTEKRRRGRPKGSKNKKTLEALAGGITTGPSSSSTAQPGEKRKRGRPPKVPYHLQFTDPSIIHDAIQSQEAADAASGKVPPKKRGRPPKNPKPQPAVDQAAGLVGSSGGAALEGQGDEAGNLAKRMRSDGNE